MDKALVSMIWDDFLYPQINQRPNFIEEHEKLIVAYCKLPINDDSLRRLDLAGVKELDLFRTLALDSFIEKVKDIVHRANDEKIRKQAEKIIPEARKNPSAAAFFKLYGIINVISNKYPDDYAYIVEGAKDAMRYAQLELRAGKLLSGNYMAVVHLNMDDPYFRSEKQLKDDGCNTNLAMNLASISGPNFEQTVRAALDEAFPMRAIQFEEETNETAYAPH